MTKSYSVFNTEQKVEFEKFNCFFVDFWKYSFGRIKVILTVVGGEYTLDLLCISIDWFLDDKRFYLTVFPNRLYSYVLENNFYFENAHGYCFKPCLSRIFCENSSVKLLSSR